MRRDKTLLAVHLVLALAAFARAMSGPADNWAVIISSSRYWLNYRHSSNALGVYQAIRRLAGSGCVLAGFLQRFDGARRAGAQLRGATPDSSSRQPLQIQPVSVLGVHRSLPLTSFFDGALAAGRASRTPTSSSCWRSSPRAPLVTPTRAACTWTRLAAAARCWTCWVGRRRWTTGGGTSAWTACCGCSQVRVLALLSAPCGGRAPREPTTLPAHLRLCCPQPLFLPALRPGLQHVHAPPHPGHHLPGTPASKRLRSGPSSRVLVFLSGHGGDEFLKFHDEVAPACLPACLPTTAPTRTQPAVRYWDQQPAPDKCLAIAKPPCFVPAGLA